ncbi:HesA/MoeB/ThiF family protein [Teredinibacter purpureus]|uniref:HesA/MoeB/ThiF family protein n=1 Tax=Teredinibacter purpureus TaxID=2731756 RepID=UPI0005F866FE|nr:molybdopterin-synthase adenylyltransferase MoeB [Teredinibacter purpureus]
MNDQQLLRYSRHILLASVGVEGQERFIESRVLIVGLGGLGSPVALYLAASGIGELVIVDDDSVEETNLQRQIIHTEKSLGKTKVTSAQGALEELNSTVELFVFDKRLSGQELLQQVEQATVVVDCSDNFTTRKQLNHACYTLNTPLVSGAAIRLEGQLTVFDFRNEQSPCYECLYQLTGDEDLSCANNGVLSPVVGVVGASQALEALKLIGGFGKPMVGQLGLFDGGANVWRYLTINKDPACGCCGKAGSV